MSSVPGNDSDSDSDLPDLIDLFHKPSNEICTGDIVWAKFKKLYWPALVRCVYKKERKLTIWYTDDPGKTFKIPISSVYLFHDLENSLKFRNEAVAAGLAQAHDGLSAHASLYISRKAEGYDDDPLKFFDQTYPYFTVEEFLRKNPNADKETFSDMKIQPLYIDHNVTSAKSPIRKRGAALVTSDDDDSELELITDDGSEEQVTVTHASQKYINSHPNSQENVYINKIVSCITSGKADMHLSNVIYKKIPSAHHQFYLKAMKSNKKDLDCISYGPIEDLKKLREVIFYLLDLYDRVSSNKSKKRMKLAIPHSTGSKIEDARYVASVWLPESIIFAISHVNDISLSEANKQFYQKSAIKSETDVNLTTNISEAISITESGIKVECDKGIKSHKNVISEKVIAGASSQKPLFGLADILGNINGEECTMKNLEMDPTNVHLSTASKKKSKRTINILETISTTESGIKVKNDKAIKISEDVSDKAIAGTSSQKSELFLAVVLKDIGSEYAINLKNDSSDAHFSIAGKKKTKRMSKRRKKSRQ